MRSELLSEPEIEFADGHRHIDPRFGILQFGPLDVGTQRVRRSLRVGIAGTHETIEKLTGWFARCAAGLPAKESRQPNLFPRFPGFVEGSAFDTSIVLDGRLVADVPANELARVTALGKAAESVDRAVALFMAALQHIVENGPVDVLVCAPPAELLHALEAGRAPDDPNDKGLDEGSDEATPGRYAPAFHDLLKARGMVLPVPIQMIRQETYDATARRQVRRGRRPREMQDEATRAWNFFTALYHKAGGTPWRLVRDATDFTTCFVGVSFYRTLDDDRVMASVAQVFNERGEGVIVRGAEALLDKDDRQPHLGADDSAKLVVASLAAYRAEHRTTPARLVLHKTSNFSSAEIDGFQHAAASEKLSLLDLVSVRRSWMRLYRQGTYPPLRGTWVDLDGRTGLLYLRGSVEFFATYPGMYVPRPLEFVRERGGTSSRGIASEMLALSKLNWNNTQFDGGEPITVRAARRVGDILKNVPAGTPVRARFRFFM